MQGGGAKLSGSDRFVIARTLGAGGMGVVYEAFDRERSGVVALKALRNMDPASLYRFKREFRALADLSHPNLVSLYELFSIGDDWFFTMELVQGRSFLEHVRSDPNEVHDTDVDITQPTTTRGEPTFDSPPLATRRAPADLGRLLPALEQLVHGLSALHAAGRLHRDIKPSNVLVTDAGRVVICDFGLVTEARGELTDASRDHVVGTIAYMSPEQAAGLALDEASDWYSVGVVLYQALTGELPFRGEPRRVMIEKQMREAPPPSVRASSVPSDLDQLCARLLKMAPEQRPGATEVLAALGAEPLPAMHVTSRAARFVGRSAELERLHQAFAETRAGKPVIVRVHGASGMGKSTLVRQFTSELVAEGRALVLSGRSYERESVPYKALDSLVDAISSRLRRLSRSDAERVVPPDVQALVRLFPVLRRAPAIAEAPPSFEVPDPQESRLRASAALRELVRRLATLEPLVLHLDDLQWGDTDSAPLIADLVRTPDAAPVLLIVSYRSEDAETSPLLSTLFGRGPASLTGGDVRDVALAALSSVEARDLALSLFESDRSGVRADAEAVARESRGNPLFVQELVRHVHLGAERGTEEPLPVALEDALAARVRALPAPARALLEMVAIAGRPIPIAVASDAAGLEGEQNAALSLLRAERLVRSRGTRHNDEIEPFHDRIREAVTNSLDAGDQRRCHQRLVVALETVGAADPEALVEHLLGAGERERAARQAEIAADHAGSALAFDRAARLYQLALDGRKLGPAEATRVWTKLGDALVNAGRGADAAAAYERALSGANPAETLELSRRKAEQLLRSGHLDEGLAAVREVLSQVGMKLAATPRRALASLVVGRARIRLRGQGFVERDASELSPAELTRIDACWSVATAVGMTDFIRGADFQTRHLLLALRAGEPHRVARGLAVETAYSGGSGGPSRRRTAELTRTTQALAARLGSPHLDGLSVTVVGIAAFLQGRWREARQSCERGEAIFRERCTGVAWELASAQFFGLGALYNLGAISELVARVPGLLREAEERGDLYRATGLRSWRTNVAWLALDDPETARFQVDEAIRRWTRHGFHLQHYYEIFSLCQIDLYAGRPEQALDRIRSAFPELERSMLLRIQNVRVESLYVRARASLALRSPEHWKSAEHDARAIERERMPWSDPYAHVIRAAVAWQRTDAGAAARELETAISGFEAADMALFAVASRHALGIVIGGERGAALVRAAEAWMSEQRIVRPERMAAMLVPGFSM